jgi:hypothetical protein
MEGSESGEWLLHLDTIKRLFIAEGRTLADVKNIMLRDFGIRGTYGWLFPFVVMMHLQLFLQRSAI